MSRLMDAVDHGSGRLLRRGLKLAHLRLLAALGESGALGVAAGRLGLTQPAASRLLAEVEGIVGRPVHARSGRGLRLTPEGEALAARAARALAEVAAAEQELAEIGAGAAGHVRVGSVTGPALDRLLPALLRARETLGGVTCEVEVAPSDGLAALLLAGRLDFALARLPEGRDRDLLDALPLGEEPVSLVARPGHPLARGGPVRPRDLLRFDWVLPGEGAILRRTVLDRLSALGLPAPTSWLSTSSFLFTLAALQDTDAVAPMATAVARPFAGEGAALRVLPVDLGVAVPTYGLLTRRGSLLTPAAARLRDLVAEA